MVAGYARAVDRDMKTVIGKSCADLDGEHVRTAETNLGNMIADVMRTASGADIGLMNGGGIRTTIPKGTITLKDIWSVLPFNNYLVVLKLQGRHILQALEHGMAKVERSSGAFLQVSGMEMIYKGSDPPGSRVKMVWIDGQLLDLDKEYRVAMNDFIAAGGDGFEFLKDFPPDSIAERGQLVSDLVIDYIRGREEVCPRIEGRIRRLEEDRRVRQ
jgi:2',3'-cyclic-nucleotide 2'-phosphodiesterase (5'-nucleotidase family)